MFVFVAFVFWIVLSLDNEVQEEFDIPIEIINVPDSVTIVSPIPAKLNVSVKTKATQLVRFWGLPEMPKMKINFREFASMRDKKLSLTRVWLDNCLRDYFGPSTVIASCHPDSLKLLFTTAKGRRVPLFIDADVQPNIQSIMSGPIETDVDSVTIYAYGDIPNDIIGAYTEPIVRSGLSDTTYLQVKVKPMSSIKIVPDEVTVMIPIEPLIAQKRTIPVEILNAPRGTDVVAFPSKVEMSYLIGLSNYRRNMHIVAYVDCQNIEQGRTKVKLTLGSIPPYIHNVSLHPDSVEYILQHNVTK